MMRIPKLFQLHQLQDPRSEQKDIESEGQQECLQKTPTGKKPKTSSGERHGVTIGNIPFRIREDEVSQFFSDCGTVTEVNLCIACVLSSPNSRLCVLSDQS